MEEDIQLVAEAIIEDEVNQLHLQRSKIMNQLFIAMSVVELVM